MNGLLFNSENYQALNHLIHAYSEEIQCIYIDPPYNRGGDDFNYKDNFQHSSWLSMMYDRLMLARECLTNNGVILISIGREEIYHLQALCDVVFGANNRIGDLIWEKIRKNDAKLFSLGHDYILVYAKNKEFLEETKTIWREEKPGAKEILDEYRRLKQKYGEDYGSIQKGIRDFYRSLTKNHPSLRHRRYSRVDRNGIWRDDNISWPGGGGPEYDVIHPKTGQPCKVPEGGWRFASHEKFMLYHEHGFIKFREDHSDPPFLKRYLNYVPTDFDPDARRRNTDTDGDEEANVQVMPSVFYRSSQPSVRELRDFMGDDVFDNPKDTGVVARLIEYVSSTGSTVLDFFAGSGTTGHAAINIQRQSENRTHRKYILVEMGEHFDSVVKPRLMKAVFSATWDGGVPQDYDGESHMFKYHILESYEDALNNLQVQEPDGAMRELLYDTFDDYQLHYMLDHETKGSPTLLTQDSFEKPFDYTLQIQRGHATPQPTAVDLEETFNYLIGLRVHQREIYEHQDRRYVIVRGSIETETGIESTVVFWRDTAELDHHAEADWASETILLEPVDRIYTNGPSHIKGAEPLEITFRERMEAGPSA